MMEKHINKMFVHKIICNPHTNIYIICEYHITHESIFKIKILLSCIINAINFLYFLIYSYLIIPTLQKEYNN